MTSTDTGRRSGSSCPLCGGGEAKPLFLKSGYSIVRCSTCGLQHVKPMPTDDEVRAHYQDPGYFRGGGDQGYDDYAQVRKALVPLFRRRMQQIATAFPQSGRLLDYGCAAGYFLEVARESGWDVVGLEISENMAEQTARRLGVRVGFSLQDLAGQRFEVVTLWEVVEHLRDPVHVLGELRGLLRPNGLLALSTPNTGHWQAESQPASWDGYRPPSHLTFFTAVTLKRLLTQSGFTGVSITRTAPLPPLPRWLERLSVPLRQSVASGRARPWPLALLAWRAVRLLGWAWQQLEMPDLDIYATLEAVARRG